MLFLLNHRKGRRFLWFCHALHLFSLRLYGWLSMQLLPSHRKTDTKPPIFPSSALKNDPTPLHWYDYPSKTACFRWALCHRAISLSWQLAHNACMSPPIFLFHQYRLLWPLESCSRASRCKWWWIDGLWECIWVRHHKACLRQCKQKQYYDIQEEWSSALACYNANYDTPHFLSWSSSSSCHHDKKPRSSLTYWSPSTHKYLSNDWSRKYL